jgi:hypothetical protein
MGTSQGNQRHCSRLWLDLKELPLPTLVILSNHSHDLSDFYVYCGFTLALRWLDLGISDQLLGKAMTSL